MAAEPDRHGLRLACYPSALTGRNTRGTRVPYHSRAQPGAIPKPGARVLEVAPDASSWSPTHALRKPTHARKSIPIWMRVPLQAPAPTHQP